jgi:omega-hydroxy-beta-dihydromenaquinone-9 sulfotransferase
MTRRLRLTRPAWQRLLSKIEVADVRLSWRTNLSYWFTSISSSLLLRLQYASHADALKTADPPAPIFLLGFWRSGTTLLHELFSCDQRFGYASTYACLNPAHFLLTEALVRERTKQPSVRRAMDNMSYSWSSPQEDEFALLSLGASSPYEALLLPSLMRDPRSLLHPPGQEEQERWKNTLLYFLRLLTVQQNKPIVLKSPPHGFHLPLLPSLFPAARYVIIERNPYEVFASNLKLWRTLVDIYGLEPVASEVIESFVLAAYVLHEETIAEGVRRLPPQSFARVRYEDLVADPVQQLRRLYAELGLTDFESVRSRVERHAATVAEHKRNHFLLSASQKASVESAWGEIIRDKGYMWGEEYVRLA